MLARGGKSACYLLSVDTCGECDGWLCLFRILTDWEDSTCFV